MKKRSIARVSHSETVGQDPYPSNVTSGLGVGYWKGGQNKGNPDRLWSPRGDFVFEYVSPRRLHRSLQDTAAPLLIGYSFVVPCIHATHTLGNTKNPSPWTNTVSSV